MPSSPTPDEHDWRGEHETPPHQHPDHHGRGDGDGHADRDAHGHTLLAPNASNRRQAAIDASSLLNWHTSVTNDGHSGLNTCSICMASTADRPVVLWLTTGILRPQARLNACVSPWLETSREKPSGAFSIRGHVRVRDFESRFAYPAVVD